MTGSAVRATLGGLFAVVVLSHPGAAEAQSRAGARLRGLDRNHDGVITRQEWRGSTRSFQVHDWNDDGVLSGGEILDEESSQDDAGTSSADGRWRSQFADLDRDRDGRLARAEWPGDRAAFDRLDRDGDGYLNRREFAYGGSDRASRFAAMDRNGDGQLTRGEWQEGADAFDWLDRNGDGVLTRTEAIGDDAAGGRDAFSELDANGDGVISREEWPDAQSAFGRVDKDRNGAITRSEWNGRGTANAPRSRAYRAGYERGTAEGRQAGREDKAIEHWDLEGQRELEQADSGYTASLGARADYQAGYREGFRLGYAEGFGPRR